MFSFFSKREKRISEACENGDAEMVAKLLREGGNINCQDKSGDTLLHKAAWYGYNDIVLLLIKAGCNIHSKNHIGDTPLHHAAYNGHNKVAASFINAGVMLDAKNNDGWTPLHYAAHSGHEKTVELLINAGASLDTQNQFMKTPLLLAFENNQSQIVDIIKESFSLLNAIATGNCKEALKLLGQGACIGPNDATMLLHLAAKRDFPSIVKLLVKRNININQYDDKGKSALHLAVQVGSSAVVKVLVNSSQINLNIEDADGNTPLHIAAQYDKATVIRLLMYADFNRKNKNGKTALYIAAESGNVNSVKELLQFQTDRRIQGPTGDTPLSIAKRNGFEEIAGLLESTTVNPTPMVPNYVVDTVSPEPDIAPAIQASKAPLFNTDENIPAPKSEENFRSTQIIPDEKNIANPSERNAMPLYTVPPEKTKEDIVKAVNEGECNFVHTQLNCGVDPNIVAGDSLLHLAVRASQTNVLNLLLRVDGIDVQKRNLDNMTPLILAIKLGHRHIAARIHAFTVNAIFTVEDSAIELDIGHNLGSGGFGAVYKGTFQNQSIAVKTAHAGKEDALKQEINTMLQCPSPYVIGIIAMSGLISKQLKLALEFMDCGDLRGYLDAKRDNKPTKMVVTPLEVAWVVANALADLHHAGIIHRDLKSNNILLSTEYYIKLGDLGISREYAQSMTTRAGTPYWEAPEVLKSGHYGYAADIYSFGVILTELETFQMPFAGSGLSLWTIIEKVSKGTLRPTVSSNCEPWLKDLSEMCLQYDPKQRPTAQNVVDLLRVQLENAKRPTTLQVNKKTNPFLSGTSSIASTASLSSTKSTSAKFSAKWTLLACKGCKSYNPITLTTCLKCSLPLPDTATKLSTLLKRIEVAKQKGFEIETMIECEECLQENPLNASICDHCQNPFPFQSEEEKLQALVNQLDMTPPQ
ncbi:ankyrin repeat domain-containing protein 50-like [Thraustotheca clavata]|uniref:Ankyrin repeat domain-containing protein 50-like n=1 Tax=Thraustotheca clavata TaxID=74557 RepID=A0A1V9ZXU3_9STRA|nr:ankyrin repeat domain-containing protein 50-like [Thraustotheca clavata]